MYLTRVLENPLRSGLLAFWIATAPILCVLYMMVPASPDQALFDYIAWMNVHGAPYYKGAAEQNWPGEILIHELGIRLFGVHFWTFRLIDFLIMQIGNLGIFWFLRRAGFSIAPFIALAVYPVIYVTAGHWMAGQRDIIATEFLILACALLITSSLSPARLAQAAAAGALIAFAVLVRPTYVSFLFGVLLLEIWGFFRKSSAHPIRRCLSILVGFVSVTAIVLFFGWLAGNLGDWYDQTILFNLQAYELARSRIDLLYQLGGMLRGSWHWLSLFSAIGILLWIFRRGPSVELFLVLGIALTIVLSYFVQGKGFGYHLGGLIPLFVLTTAVAIDLLTDIYSATRARLRWIAGACMIVMIAITAAGTASKANSLAPQFRTLASGRFAPVHSGGPSDALTHEEMQKIVQRIQSGSAADEPIFQWGRNFMVGFLSQRPSSSRFVSTPALEILSDRFARTQAWLAEFESDLTTKSPAYILIERQAIDTPQIPIKPLVGASPALRILIERVNAGYRPVLADDKVVLFERESR